jgi:Ca2+-binding RTX toxin-like protein
MPGSFTFNSEFTSANFLSQTLLSAGAGNGIDNPALFSAQGGTVSFSNNARSIVPVAVTEGQVLRLDVDYGSSNNIDTIDTKLYVVDATGKILASNDSSAADSGSTGTTDPKLNYTAAETGLLFVIVVQKDKGYIDNELRFNNGGTDAGVFQLNIALSGLSNLVSGTSGADTVTLTLDQKRYRALGGDDNISAAAVDTVIDGGSGNDNLNGNTRSDILYGESGSDYLSGYARNDVLVGGTGADSLYGGLGRDELFGGNDGDYLSGDDGADILWGEDGDDSLSGGTGNDLIFGGAGYDYFYLDSGDDVLDGGDLGGTIYAYSGSGALTIDLRITTAQDTGSFGFDTITNISDATGANLFGDTITGNDLRNSLNGYGGADTITGLGGNDNIYGGNDNDVLSGGDGEDSISGENGDDVLSGGADTDFISGGLGHDLLTGGTGNDSFYFGSEADSLPIAVDVITDFSHIENDHINLASLPGTLQFRGSGPFLNTGGEVRTVDFGAFQRVYVNVDTDSEAEMVIRVNTPDALVIADFTL